MLKTDPANDTFEFDFTQDDFEHLRKMVTDHTGIQLPDNKKTLMYTRLVRRLRSLNLDSFKDYIRYQQQQIKADNTKELMIMVNAMTTNVTDFFREQHHFKHFFETVPALLEEHKKIKIWCCAASTGEEPWTIAMVSKRLMEKFPGTSIEITATDIDENVLKTAQTGIYQVDQSVIAGNPFMKRFLKEIEGESEGKILANHKTYQINPDLKKMVTFKKLNLIKQPWPLSEKMFHVVFCRNVIIYFSKETQKELFTHISSRMPSGSLLYIGHSESLINVSTDYDNIGRTTYRKQ